MIAQDSLLHVRFNGRSVDVPQMHFPGTCEQLLAPDRLALAKRTRQCHLAYAIG